MYEVRRGYDFRTKRRMMDEAGNVERPACYEPQATHFPFVSNIDTSGAVLSPRQWYSAIKRMMDEEGNIDSEPVTNLRLHTFHLFQTLIQRRGTTTGWWTNQQPVRTG